MDFPDERSILPIPHGERQLGNTPSPLHRLTEGSVGRRRRNNRMKGSWTVWWGSLYGFLLLWGQSIALVSRSYAIQSRSNRSSLDTPRLPWKDHKLHPIGSVSRRQPTCRKRSDSKVPPWSLCGVPSSVGILERVIDLGRGGSLLKSHPFLASFFICALKASAADCFAQLVVSRKPSRLVSDGSNETNTTSRKDSSFSFRRNLALLSYGGLYQGCCQEFIYNHWFVTLFGAGNHLRAAIQKVAFDMLLVQPLVSLPMAYLIKAPLVGQSLTDALWKYGRDIQKNRLLQTCWMVWTPTQLVSFTVIPTHLRITFMACISFVWIILFSTISNQKDDT